MTKVFIDGSAGTTGLRIADRMAQRQDISLITLPEALRKDPQARQDAINSAEIVFLCLPDSAAIESAGLVRSAHVKIIDTSTAHRTDPQWVYGFPELRSQREKLAESTRVANPGCHASGFIALIAPLVQEGLLLPDAALSCFSLTGYSGGGKKMIAEYEDAARSALLKGPRQYALGQSHKHLPEMAKVCGLTQAPVFCPVVGDFYSGMEVTIPLFAKDIKGSLADIQALYKDYYSQGLVKYTDAPDPDGFLSAAAFSGRDDLEVAAYGNEDRIILVSRFDNLGKGASGAAIQNMNLLLGLPEDTGLNIK